ncbi:MAG TPA: hypothetical protein VFY14_08860 [Streptomyces sp.]|nr:hypothetical protein [Streptomyces sp.]
MNTPNPSHVPNTPDPQQPHPAPFGAPLPPPHAPFPQPPLKPPSRRKGWLTHGAAAFAALIVGVGIGSSGETDATASPGDSAKPGPQPTVTVTATEKAEAKPAPTVTETVTAKPEKAEPKKEEKTEAANSFAGDGEYLVGEDIAAGTYKTAGPEGSWGCYWERSKDASGEFDSIIANNNLQGPGRVTVNKGEVFKTNRCQEWQKVG